MIKILLMSTTFWFSTIFIVCCSTVFAQFVSRAERVKAVCENILATEPAFRLVADAEWKELKVDKTKLTTFYAKWNTACALFTIAAAKYEASNGQGDIGAVQEAYRNIQALAMELPKLEAYIKQAIQLIPEK
jgi:predicted tellurium resistance membrane protein TerC